MQYRPKSLKATSAFPVTGLAWLNYTVDFTQVQHPQGLHPILLQWCPRALRDLVRQLRTNSGKKPVVLAAL